MELDFEAYEDNFPIVLTVLSSSQVSRKFTA